MGGGWRHDDGNEPQEDEERYKKNLPGGRAPLAANFHTAEMFSLSLSLLTHLFLPPLLFLSFFSLPWMRVCVCVRMWTEQTKNSYKFLVFFTCLFSFQQQSTNNKREET